MKTVNFFKVLALVSIFIIVAAANTNAEKPAIKPAMDMHTTLSTNIHFPDVPFAHRSDFEGTADVTFMVSDGKICVRSVESENAQLAEYLKKELCKVCCKNVKARVNQYYSVRFTFKLA
jgi:hypothetical protein